MHIQCFEYEKLDIAWMPSLVRWPSDEGYLFLTKTQIHSSIMTSFLTIVPFGSVIRFPTGDKFASGSSLKATPQLRGLPSLSRKTKTPSGSTVCTVLTMQTMSCFAAGVDAFFFVVWARLTLETSKPVKMMERTVISLDMGTPRIENSSLTKCQTYCL